MAGSPPPASPGGALSREQLYAPLTDYLPGGAPLGGAPAASASAASASAAAASALRIHPSVRESALAEHLAAVSAAYVSDPRFSLCSLVLMIDEEIPLNVWLHTCRPQTKENWGSKGRIRRIHIPCTR